MHWLHTKSTVVLPLFFFILCFPSYCCQNKMLIRASTPNLGILGKIYLFAYYGGGFHYLQLEKIRLYDKNCARFMHFYVKVPRTTPQMVWKMFTKQCLLWHHQCNIGLLLHFNEISVTYTGLSGNNGYILCKFRCFDFCDNNTIIIHNTFYWSRITIQLAQ